MSLWRIAWRSIQQRSLASALTAFSMGLGVALVVAVLVIHGVIEKSFRRGSQDVNLIVGAAKGGELELVLNTVYYLNLGQQLQTVPYTYYEEFVSGRFAGWVKAAIPICMGHDYQGCPAVATVPEMFDVLTYQGGQPYEFDAGRNFDRNAPFEAVVGATAAERAGLKLGDRFRPVPTGSTSAGGHGDDEFEVVGILKHSSTPVDRAVFMNIEGFWQCPAHQQGPLPGERLLGGQAAEHPDAAEPSGAEHASEEHAGEKHAGAEQAGDDATHAGHDHVGHGAVTAILVVTYADPDSATARDFQMDMDMYNTINSESVARAVRPAVVIEGLFDRIVGNVQAVLLVLAVLVVVVAGIGILVSIYNSMSDRRHEIAVMRALGARRRTVMAIILTESILLSLGGGALGLLLGHGLIGALGPQIAEQTGVIVSPLDFQLVELVLIPGLIVLATLVGYLPAVVAYRTDVARSLQAGA